MKKLLVTPFLNDPFAFVYQAFKNLYPEKEAECFYDPTLTTPAEAMAGKSFEGYGYTNFPDDGSMPQIGVGVGLPVFDTVEILAHELAHVAVGSSHKHDEYWEAAFTAIGDEYERLIAEAVSENNHNTEE